MSFDLTFHVAELLVIGAAAWRVIVAANRVSSLLKDFPPHRHVNGSVIYPDGYQPTPVQRLGGLEQKHGL